MVAVAPDPHRSPRLATDAPFSAHNRPAAEVHYETRAEKASHQHGRVQIVDADVRREIVFAQARMLLGTTRRGNLLVVLEAVIAMRQSCPAKTSSHH